MGAPVRSFPFPVKRNIFAQKAQEIHGLGAEQGATVMCRIRPPAPPNSKSVFVFSLNPFGGGRGGARPVDKRERP